MALFKIEKGLAADLLKNRPNTTEGWCYFTVDDGKFYIDIQNGLATGADKGYRVPINSDKADRLDVFDDEAALKAKYEEGQDGQICIVKSTNSLWIWNKEWKDTRLSVDLSNFYNKSEIDSKLKNVVTSVNGEIGDVTTVKTVNGVKGDVTLGMRNLLLNSGVKIGPSDAYSIAAYTFGNEKPIEGETYTVTLKGTLGAGKNFVIYNTDGNHGGGENSRLKDIGGNLYRTTLKWTVGTAANTRIVLYMIPSTVNTESTIEWITMVKGNVGTNDWVPAPEDPVTSVNGTTGAVEISDQNLLPESKTLHGWVVTGAGVRSKKDGFGVVSWTGTDTKVKGVYKSITVKKGIYTFSAFIKKTSDTEIIFWPTANTADKPKFKYPENVRITGITDVYQRISVTYEVLVDDVTTNPRFETPGYAGEYSVYAPKLQRGNVATDWSPALEDIVTSVNGGSGDVELGGRNLLPGTKDFTHQYKLNGDLDSEKYLGFTVAHANAKQTSGYIDLYWSDDIPRRKYGEDLTLSFWVKGSGVVNPIHYSVVGDVRAAFAESSKGNTVNGGNIQIPITDSWERIWVHYRMGTDGDLSVPRPFIIRCIQGSEIYICGVKAEFGTRPTDWTPAPEDLFPITGGTVTGSITATNGFVGDVTGNAATATKLAAGKNISISGGATAAAKAFDGSAAIDLAVTALDVSKATAGTLPVARGGTGATTAAAALSGLGGQPKHKTLSLTLTVATWSASNTYTITATGVTASNTVIVSPAPASWSAWADCGVRCTAQGANSLTFTADIKPTVALTAQIVILD